MLKNYFKKFTVGFLVLAIFFSFSFIPQAANASILSEKNEQLDLLMRDLILAGEFIMKSQTVTSEERLVLMTQLVAVSNAILTLKKSYVGSAPVEKNVEVGRVSAKDAKLQRVLLDYDDSTNVAKVKITTSTTTIDQVYKFASVSAITSYEARLGLLKKEILKEVSSSTNIITKDVENLMYLTSRNPNRNTYIVQNSAAADAAFQEFGKRSIIKKVIISPNKTHGSIAFVSDQDETLLLTLGKDFKENRESGTEELSTYNYSPQFFVTTDMDKNIDVEYVEGSPVFVLKPKISNAVTGVKKSDIVKVIVDLFNRVPFTSQIPNYESKLIKFLTNNSTYYLTSQNNTISTDHCYYDSDKTVMIDFIKYLSSGQDKQHEEIESSIEYAAPIVVDTERYVIPSCVNKSYNF